MKSDLDLILPPYSSHMMLTLDIVLHSLGRGPVIMLLNRNLPQVISAVEGGADSQRVFERASKPYFPNPVLVSPQNVASFEREKTPSHEKSMSSGYPKGVSPYMIRVDIQICRK